MHRTIDPNTTAVVSPVVFEEAPSVPCHPSADAVSDVVGEGCWCITIDTSSATVSTLVGEY